MADLAAFVRIVALTLAALLPIINPPGAAPVFLSMTPGLGNETRTAIARRVGLDSFVLLVAAMLVGSYVLTFFGLSLAVVKIAGGLLVIANGWRLVSDDASTTAVRPATLEADQIASRSFYPLTFPLTIGPGSVSIAMTLGASTQVAGVRVLTSVAGSMVGIAIVALTIYLSFRFASRLLNVLGTTGSVVLLRLSAFILLAVGVQIFCDGLAERFTVLTINSGLLRGQ